MSWRRLTDALLPALPFGSFATVVTGDDVTQGKPHPEAYQTAARRLGVLPQQCIAIEDSPTGARSAHAAGCVTLTVPQLVPIPAGVGHHQLATLQGVRAQDLRQIHTNHVRAAEALAPRDADR
jgi:beta-phosphoglucomutase-like phosphatase (HAD superfamily)